MVVAAPQRILAWEPESAEALQYFHSIDWCRHVLNMPGLLQFKCDYQNRKTNGWDPVVNGVLARPDIAGTSFATTSRPNQHGASGTTNPFPQHVNFYTIGADLTGIPQTVHGGVIAMLIDSAFAQLGFVHSGPRGQFYSGFTNVRFLRPLIVSELPSPKQRQQAQDQSDRGSVGSSSSVGSLGSVANVVVRAQINSIATKEGDNKMHVLAQVETDGGIVCAIGEGLVVEKVWKGKL
ncbi:hypothetical protein PG987_007284 [Apiospora arundinis]